MAKCVSGTVVGFLLPMCMCLAAGLTWLLVWYLGTAQRRKSKVAHEQLVREKDAFKDKEIQTHQAAVQRYVEEANRWKREAEMAKAASDSYKRLLEANGVSYQRQTMLFDPADAGGKRDSTYTGTTMKE